MNGVNIALIVTIQHPDKHAKNFLVKTEKIKFFFTTEFVLKVDNFFNTAPSKLMVVDYWIKRSDLQQNNIRFVDFIWLFSSISL